MILIIDGQGRPHGENVGRTAGAALSPTRKL